MSRYSDLNLRGKIQTYEVHTENDPPLTLVLFHGYGADAYDLGSLAEIIPGATKFHWIFPQGPLEVPIGPGWTGRAWWPIDINKLSQTRDISEEIPVGIESLRKKIFDMILSLKKPWGQIILGGFSQGGMLALDIAMHAPEKPKALVLLSTSVINKKYLQGLGLKLEGVPVYQSHGQSDPVIDIKNAQRLESFLQEQKTIGSLRVFPGGHEIPMQVLQKLGSFLGQL